MLQLSINMHRRNPGYEVKAVIGFHRASNEVDEKYMHKLNTMRDKLEQLLPGNMKAKYNVNAEGLTVVIKTDKAGSAQSILHKLEDYIKSAATTLKF